MLSTISSAGTCIVQWGQRILHHQRTPRLASAAAVRVIKAPTHPASEKKKRYAVDHLQNKWISPRNRENWLKTCLKAHAILGCSLLTAGECMTIQFPQNFHVVPPAVRVKGAASAGRNQPLAVAVWRRAVAFVWKARQAGRPEDRGSFFLVCPRCCVFFRWLRINENHIYHLYTSKIGIQQSTIMINDEDKRIQPSSHQHYESRCFQDWMPHLDAPGWRNRIQAAELGSRVLVNPSDWGISYQYILVTRGYNLL